VIADGGAVEGTEGGLTVGRERQYETYIIIYQIEIETKIVSEKNVKKLERMQFICNDLCLGFVRSNRIFSFKRA
jgi:hypothetical protein